MGSFGGYFFPGLNRFDGYQFKNRFMGGLPFLYVLQYHFTIIDDMSYQLLELDLK